MKTILHASQVKKLDELTINEYGIDNLILMEKAALKVAELVKGYLQTCESKRVLVVSGSGNNGGDGIACARILALWGYDVELVDICTGRACAAHDKQLEIFAKYGFSYLTSLDKVSYDKDIVVDALFGIGLNRPLNQELCDVISIMNQIKGYKIAVDIPSGLNSDTGNSMGAVFKADKTITFSYLKPGLLIRDGKLNAGNISVADIGIYCFNQYESERMLLFENVDFKWPKRNANAHKGSVGKVTVISGDSQISGACVLCAEAVLRAGAGMVKIITHANHREIIGTRLPEALTCYYNDEECLSDDIMDAIDFGSVIIIGPGIGKSNYSKELLNYVLTKTSKPLVIDADAINLIATDQNLFEILKIESTKRNIVLTPHLLEFSRLSNISMDDLKEDVISCIKVFQKQLNAVIVLKDSRTFVFTTNSHIYFIDSGCSALATAGSGDVLSGIIGSFMIQNGMNQPFESVLNAVYLHGALGERIAVKRGNEYTCLAGDLCKELKTSEWR